MSDTLKNILFVEDEEAHAELIIRAFDDYRDSYTLFIARNLEEARTTLAEEEIDLVLADFLLPDGNGLELLKVSDNGVSCPVVLMTSHGDENLAVEAMKEGALDYIFKSVSTFQEMPHIVERSLREWTHITERRNAEAAMPLPARIRKTHYNDINSVFQSQDP